MRIRSVKFNFIMNFILTASSIIFPLITFPYISRVLLVEGSGKVAFASSVLTYFITFSSLGIPTYGIRACAKVRDDKEKLSMTVQELLIVNLVTTGLAYLIFVILLAVVPKFAAERTLLLVTSTGMLLNTVGVNWLYSALEQYAYITTRSIIFKFIGLILMFAFVKSPKDYIIYGGIYIIGSYGSLLLNFLRLGKVVSLKKTGKYDFKRHIRPVAVFFGMSAASSIYLNLDTVMLGFMKGDVEVGYYNAGVKVKTVLVSLVTSLGTVLLPRLSYYVQNEDKEAFYRTIGKAFQFVFVLALSVTVYFAIFAEESILILAGKEFGGSVLPMIILMPTVLCIGLTNVMGIQMLTPMGKEYLVLKSIVYGAIVDFFLNLLIIPRFGASGAALSTTIAEAVVLVVQCVYLRGILGKVLQNVKFGRILFSIGCGTVAACVVKLYVDLSPFFVMVVSVMAFYLIYGGALVLLKEPFALSMLEMGKNILHRRRGEQ
ncbi:MAG: flippase [Hespellia sp.]|nr:flippase [Hespellia sp.]